MSLLCSQCPPTMPPQIHPFPAFSSFTAPPPPATYTLSLHDALPIYEQPQLGVPVGCLAPGEPLLGVAADRRLAAHVYELDRKSTRLNSSHANISYAVFCLKKKKQPLHPCSPAFDLRSAFLQSDAGLS